MTNYERAKAAATRDTGIYEDGAKYLVWHYAGTAPQPVQDEMTFVSAEQWFESEDGYVCKLNHPHKPFIAAERVA